MEYWLLIFLLIFLFVIYMQISALSNSVKYIREEIGRLRNELAPRLPEPTVATVEEENTPTHLADEVAVSKVWTPDYATYQNYLLTKKQSQIKEKALADSVKKEPARPIEYRIADRLVVLKPQDEAPQESPKMDAGPASGHPQKPDVWTKLENVLFSLKSPESFWKRLEQEFAARWMVWIGGVIMALGVIFLLKAGSEQGLFGPTLRIGTAIVLSVLMVVGGVAQAFTFSVALGQCRLYPGGAEWGRYSRSVCLNAGG